MKPQISQITQIGIHMKQGMIKHMVVLLAVLCTTMQAGDIPVEGGLVVCIGTDALASMASDWEKSGCVFHCLETSDTEIAKLRTKIQSAGCYGKVSVARFDGQHLPYINNLVNLLVFKGEQFNLNAKEVERVLAPYGQALAPPGSACMPKPVSPLANGFIAFTKPYPTNMDEWPQYLHGADNNCVAQDAVVGPPRHVQWISGPAWTRAHIGAATISSMVSSGGRLFTIEDRETAENPLLPAQWKLITRNAFNGVVLWTRDYPDWEQVTVYIKDYHAQMQRRLVAIGNTVYCTLGLIAPVTALDATTGNTIRTFKGTEGTQEFAFHTGRIYAVIGDRMSFYSYRGSGDGNERKKQGKKKKEAAAASGNAGMAFNGNGFALSRYNPRTKNAEKPACVIAALDARTGRELWRSATIADYVGCTLALKGDRLVYQSAHGVYCLNAHTGTENWSVNKEIPYGVGSRPNSLVLSKEAVYSEEGQRVHAYALADGSDYWGKSIAARKGYQASTDLLIAADALWMCGACNNAKGIVTKKPTSYDLKTGEEIKTIPQILSKPMGHDRCFRNFITERFFINSKTGGADCMDMISDAEYPAPFMRGTCSMGPLPCNGLIYAGPYACQCHLPVGLHNFNAYYTNEASLPTQGQAVQVERSVRLEKGPAYRLRSKSRKTGDAPWPTYRQDMRRYARTTERVPATGLKRRWRVHFQNAASAPVIAEGKVFVAETDAHVLRALDADTGKILWNYIAGARIDSPPTYYRGLLLFGSRDGWVHCVRASDGAVSWRFRDLPDKMICVFDQLESAWSVHGSVLVKNDTAYFCAGRSSYLDGGLFIYGLNPVTGEIRYQRRFYGPYAENGFPAFVKEGNRSETEVILGTTADVMTCEGDTLYIRQQAFNLDLTNAEAGTHLLASAGMLESHRNHREYKLVKEDFNHRKMWTTLKTDYPTGDIIVSDGTDYYSVFGIPVNRGESFNARNGYALMAKTKSPHGWTNKWTAQIPITGKAMALAHDTVFVTGAPLVFKLKDIAATYAGRCGGILRAVSAANGATLAEYSLDTLPVWDGLAVAYGRLFLVNQGGSIDCWGKE
jgi:outer membrane protein assembly factor BamB